MFADTYRKVVKFSSLITFAVCYKLLPSLLTMTRGSGSSCWVLRIALISTGLNTDPISNLTSIVDIIPLKDIYSQNLYTFAAILLSGGLMNITIKLSGHILFPSLSASSAFKGYVESILKLRRAGNSLFIVVGGGEPIRYYIRIARENGLDESSCDQVGIAATHINAKIFARALGKPACQLVPTDFDELDEAISTDKIVVMGGLQPGQSTNAVAALLAERSNSKLLINTTNVDGIYDSDPKRNPKAKRFDRISISEVAKILDKTGMRAGEYDLLDHVAIKIISRSRITTRIIDGSDPRNILKAVSGRIGTTIVP